MDFDHFFSASKDVYKRALVRDSADLENLCHFLIDQSDQLDNAELIKLIRTLRNFCCADTVVSELYIKLGVISTVVEKCKELCFAKSGDDDEDIAQYENNGDDEHNNKRNEIILAYCQLISNFSASGDICSSHLMKLSDVKLDKFRDLLAVSTVCRNSKITAAVLGLIYNTICSDTSTGHYRLEVFCGSRAFLCQLMLLIMDTGTTAGQEASRGHPETPSSSSTDPVVEWFQLIGLLLVRRNKMGDVYRAVGPSETSSDEDSAVNHEQLIVLQLFLSILEDTYCASDVIAAHSRDPAPVDDLILELSRAVCALDGERLMVFDTNKPVDKQTAIEQVDRVMHVALNRDFTVLALQVVGTVLSVLSDSHSVAINAQHQQTGLTSDARDLQLRILQETHLIPFCSALIKDHHVGARIQRDRNYTQENKTLSTTTDGAEKSSPPEVEESVKSITKSALQLLGNIVYRCKEAQNLLRECGGLATILSHCVTDFSNPLAREWALFATRNACADCLENQEYIESLRPQNVSVQDADMKAKGLEVEMSSETGKFRLVQKEAPIPPPPPPHVAEREVEEEEVDYEAQGK